MTIQTNMFALRSSRERNKTVRAREKNLEKLSSGLRINRAGDDAAGLSVSEKTRGHVTDLGRCRSNVSDGIALARAADGALQEINDILLRARKLCTEAENSTYTYEERDAVSDELNQLFSEVDRITSSSEFNTIPLFRGDVSEDVLEESEILEVPEDEPLQLKFSDLQIYTGAGTEGSSMGETKYVSIHLPYIDLKTLGLTPPEMVDLNAKDQNVDNWLKRVDRANTAIFNARGTIGSEYSRLEHAFQSISESNEELTSTESVIRDADVAELMAEDVKLQILTQSQESMQAQANAQPQQVLELMT